MSPRNWTALAAVASVAVAVTATTTATAFAGVRIRPPVKVVKPPVKAATPAAKAAGGAAATTGAAGTTAGAAATTAVTTAAVDRVTSFTQALATGDPAAVCGKGMLCRALGGAGCSTSKSFFSACYVLCSRQPGFRESHCVQNAVRAHTFDPQRAVYTRGSSVQNEPPAAHLVRQIVKSGSENAEVKAGLCSVCGVIQKAPAASRRQMLGASAGSFDAACKRSCS